MLRRILSVLIGVVVWSALWLGANAGLAAATPDSFEEDGSTESKGILLALLACSVVFSLVSGCVTATVGKEKPVGNAFVLGVVLLAIGIPVQMGYWEVMPQWYHFSFLGLLLPASVIGGWRRAAKKNRG